MLALPRQTAPEEPKGMLETGATGRNLCKGCAAGASDARAGDRTRPVPEDVQITALACAPPPSHGEPAQRKVVRKGFTRGGMERALQEERPSLPHRAMGMSEERLRRSLEAS